MRITTIWVMGEDENSLDGEGQIHNGADDNASGTAALMELARILYNTKDREQQLFIHCFFR